MQSSPCLAVMASNRSNLALDEQSFQGLLAAAFTIQEHNDRANAGQQFPDTERSAIPKPEPPKACDKCGAPLPSDGSICPNCSDASLRPGERLQRNWASMWLMSQDLHLTSSPADGDSMPLSAGDPGRHRPKPAEPGRTVPAVNPQLDMMGRQDSEIAQDEPHIHDATAEGSHLGSSNHNSYSAQEQTLAAWPVGTAEPVEPEEFPHEESGPASSESLTMVEESFPETEEAANSDGEAITPIPSGPRVKVRFQRADLYLGLAVLVLAAALFWPTGPSREPKVPTWERILIAIGIAEEPPPAVHYHGDPDLKVWVDTHTALYYCPGDELYGKSPGGHYSTQRDAQSDRFEPAERSVCVE